VISLKKAKKLLKVAVKSAVKEARRKDKIKQKKALKKQVKAMAPVRKNPSAGQKFREADKKMGLRQKAYYSAKKAAKEAAKKSKGARAAEVITKAHEHTSMMAELAAAKDAQAASLNFEEQVIMADSPSSKKVIIAKAHKTAAVLAEEKADAEFQKAKRVLKAGLTLQMKMKENKIKSVEKLVRTKSAAKKAESKHKVAGNAYKAEEVKEKNAADEKKEKMAAKARVYLKQMNKKAERHAKAVEAATTNNKEGKMKKCRKAQIKMRALQYKLKRRLRKQLNARARKDSDRQVDRFKAGLKKEEIRRAEQMRAQAAAKPVQQVREEFDMSKAEVASLVEEQDLGESADPPADTKAEAAEVGTLTMKAEKAKVTADFKKKEQVDAADAAAKASKEVSEKSEELNQLNLDLKGTKDDEKINSINAQVAALTPDLDKAQVGLKKLEDTVVELKNAADELERTAADDTKAADTAKAQLTRNEEAANTAKMKLQEDLIAAQNAEKAEEFKLEKNMLEHEAEGISKIRRHARRKAMSHLKVKWAEMKRTLKLKTIKCEAKDETETEKLKKKLKQVTAAFRRIKKENNAHKKKAKRKADEEKRAKRYAKQDAGVQEQQFEAKAELAEKAKIKEIQNVANKEVEAAKADEAKEKTIAKANEKKADVAMAEAKAEAGKVKAAEQDAAAKKVAGTP